ncbi:Hypothetical predicted protein [Cloeon dipterum]|uniref:Uncharacterized protein n=1 Tax=Cloeon dipterum TaxID=197152 RepID=A0A8S1D0F9_9INSE|nr:Hypothetical predicted protein [Cloeon dipterum]
MVRAQGDGACMDQMGIKTDQQEKLKTLKKYYCISQCMGGFGGEVDFCKSDGICLEQPTAPSGYSAAMNMPRT